MNKRGQITLFVVIGIVIIAIIGIALFFKAGLTESLSEAALSERVALSEEEKNVVSIIDDCVIQTLELGLLELSNNGGYYPAKQGSVSYLAYNVPLYYIDGEENLPELENVALGLARFVESNVQFCLTGHMEIVKTPKVKVVLGRNVRAYVEMPINFEEKGFRLKRFFGEVDIDYNSVLIKVQEFYNLVKKYNGTMDALEMGRVMNELGYDYSYDTVDNNLLFLLSLDEMINDEPLVMSFAIRKTIVEDEISINNLNFLSALHGPEEKFEEEILDGEIPDDLVNFTESELPELLGLTEEENVEGGFDGI